ncbi:putative T7SS-secreted protein, partial [Nocardioides sp. R-C-SC26]|uniref:putative T7SS-secreted protein n=1 Tax=Nocardioides sp. R-C-SC26 TaxID=2870414 RepID=UPI001E3F5494
MAAPPRLELGESDDPKQLIPGDVATVNKNAQALADERTTLATAKSDLDAITAEDAIDAGIASMFYGFDRSEMLTMATNYDTALKTAHDALTVYSGELAAAQEGAQRAIDKWNEGEAATAKAQADWNAQHTAPQQGGAPPLTTLFDYAAGQPTFNTGPAFPILFFDPGAALREEARQILNDARDDLLEAAGQALHTLGVDEKQTGDGSGEGDGDDDSPFSGPSIDWDGWKKDFGNSTDDILPQDPSKKDDDESPWSLSLGSVEGGVAVYDKDGKFENYFGDVKVAGDGSVTVLGVDGKAEATISKDGVVVGVEGTATLVGTEGQVSASLGPAEVGVNGSASIEASASGEASANWKEGVHAGGEVFVGGRADVGATVDAGGG